jgi:ribosomal protein L11 methyltransferase
MPSPTLLIANINRNILLADMPSFSACLSEEGELLLSGFYTEDVPVLLANAATHGLYPVHQSQDSNWALLLLKKGKSS